MGLFVEAKQLTKGIPRSALIALFKMLIHKKVIELTDFLPIRMMEYLPKEEAAISFVEGFFKEKGFYKASLALKPDGEEDEYYFSFSEIGSQLLLVHLEECFEILNPHMNEGDYIEFAITDDYDGPERRTRVVFHPKAKFGYRYGSREIIFKFD